MKNLLFSALLILSASTSIAQPEMYVDSIEHAFYVGSVLPADFDTHDFNGEVIEMTPQSSSEMIIDIHVENHTGATVDWKVSRRRINVESTWSDYLCWGHSSDPFGTCIPASLMDQGVWIGPNSTFIQNLSDGEAGKLAIHIDPNVTTTGCGLYRYYVGTELEPFLDSVDINVCFTVGMNEQELPSLSIAPNPANNQVTIKGSTSGTLQIVNALGQVVFENEFANETTIDVTSLESGMYFVILQSEGLKPVKEKIIIE